MKFWGKLIKNNKCINDITVSVDDSGLTRTKKVFSALEQICIELDLSAPIWLDKNISDFTRSSRTRFYGDSFIESIEFDFFEFIFIEED